jgi:hypothetical protein
MVAKSAGQSMEKSTKKMSVALVILILLAIVLINQ